MATITIRNLDDDLKTRLRVRASSHDHSMEEEARIILKEALRQEEPQAGAGGLGTRIRRRFADIGAEELPLPHRDEPARKPDNFT